MLRGRLPLCRDSRHAPRYVVGQRFSGRTSSREAVDIRGNALGRPVIEARDFVRRSQPRQCVYRSVAAASRAFHPTVNARNVICQKVPFVHMPPLTELEGCVCACAEFKTRIRCGAVWGKFTSSAMGVLKGTRRPFPLPSTLFRCFILLLLKLPLCTVL